MVITLKQRIESILELTKYLKESVSLPSSLENTDIDINKQYVFNTDFTAFGGKAFSKGEILPKIVSQNSRFLALMTSDGKLFNIPKAVVDEYSSVTIKDTESIKNAYKKAKDFINRIESDITLNGIVNDEEIDKIATRLANMPNFDIENTKLIVAMLKAEILEQEQPIADVAQGDR
mgnify:CR=1 FL=1